MTVNDFSLLFIILMEIAVNNDETDLKTEGGRSELSRSCFSMVKCTLSRRSMFVLMAKKYKGMR